MFAQNMHQRVWKVGIFVMGLVLLLGIGCSGDGGNQEGSAAGKTSTGGSEQAGSTVPNGVKSYSNLSRSHTKGLVNYPQTPPVGGPHNPVWQNCGFYSKPVRNENAVHSMEHGAVWITYRPDLARGQVETLRDLAQSNSYVLVSPYPDLPSPVMASAWGKQLRLDSANDPRLEQFVSAYRQGPQTPEPGAPCSGGVGSPE